MIRPLPRDALPVDTEAAARFLLGKLIVRETAAGRMAGRIVETEAYVLGDAACHAYRRETPRNGSLFRDRGHAYVYRAYGICWMLNVSGETEGVGAGTLIRAIEPVEGAALMALHRKPGVAARDLTRGPGRLAEALAIDRTLNGRDLCAPGPLHLADDGHPPIEPGVSVRIGITKDADRKLRFFVRGNRYVSGPAALNGR